MHRHPYSDGLWIGTAAEDYTSVSNPLGTTCVGDANIEFHVGFGNKYTKRFDCLLEPEPTRDEILPGTANDDVVVNWQARSKILRLRRRAFLLYE